MSSAEPEAQDALRRLLRAAHEDIEQPPAAEANRDRLTARLVALAKELIPGAESCALATATVGSPIGVLAQSDDLAASAIELQLKLAAGPALELLGRHGTEIIIDARHDLRWPRLCRELAGMGALSLAAADLPMTDRSRGIVVICSSKPGAFGTIAEVMVPLFASRVSNELRQHENLTNLSHAIESRQLIGQAVGILMERRRVTADGAFELLVHASQTSNVKLRVIADRVIETGQEPGDVFAPRSGE